MITSWPLDNSDYTAEAIGAFSGTRTRGVFSADDNLSCTAIGGRQIAISNGLAWLKKSQFWGVALLNTEPIIFECDVASGTLSRYIAVVARLDKDANKPEILLRYGALSASPVMPTLIRDIHADELFLHSVIQRAGSVEITAADITDLRTSEAYCGIMRDGVTGIPTAQLQKQADALITQLNEAIKTSLSGALPDKSVSTSKFAPNALAPNGFIPYSHAKADTVHELTGTGENIKFIATENYLQGDTFSVNNKAVGAKNLVGFKSSDVVSCFLNGSELDFGHADANSNFRFHQHVDVNYTGMFCKFKFTAHKKMSCFCFAQVKTGIGDYGSLRVNIYINSVLKHEAGWRENTSIKEYLTAQLSNIIEVENGDVVEFGIIATNTATHTAVIDVFSSDADLEVVMV